METAAAAILIGACALAGTQALAAARFGARIESLAGRLGQSPPAADASARLPAVVAAFARRAGAGNAAAARTALFRQEGELRLRQGGAFAPVRARQVVALGRAGFLWDARQTFGPLPRLRVVDAFVDGEGLLEARLFGSVPVARLSGGDLSLGEAFRYLAELPWAPDAIPGNPDLDWTMTDAAVAEVRLAVAGGTARVCFSFDSAGDIVGMEARGRPARDASGRMGTLDWRGRFGDYRQIGPRRLPEFGEVGYVYPGTGYEPYFRGRIREYSLAS